MACTEKTTIGLPFINRITIQPGKLPAIHRPGRVPVREILTSAKIRNKAEELLNSDRSNLRNVVLEMLYEFVILSEASLFRLAFERLSRGIFKQASRW